MPDYIKYRAMMHHLILIDEQIRSGSFPNASTLARDLELSVRTINRKLEFMRDVLGAPLKYEPGKKGFRYDQLSWSLPNIQMTEGELLGLAMAQMALHAYKDTPLESYLRKVSEKICAVMPDTVRLDPRGLANTFRFTLGPVAHFDPKIWELLARATRELRSVQMRYFSLAKNEVVDRTIDPYFLRCYRGDWYLIGHDHRTGHIPMYSLARIKRLRLTNQRFTIAAGFSPDQYLAGTFGVFESKERHNVRIRFRNRAAMIVGERNWHPTQKLTTQKDGSVVLSMTLSDVEEIGRWVLTWGTDAEALAPRALCDFVGETAAATAKSYNTRRKHK